VPVIFLLLEGVALHYYASSTVHSRARLLGLSDAVMGGVYGSIAGTEHYMSLGRTNRMLEERVATLENELSVYRAGSRAAELDSLSARVQLPHRYVAGRVVRNSTGKRENYIMVDRGTRDGVERGMAVVSPEGYMAGYVEDVSERNAICVSVLNTTFRASGLVTGTGHFGSISWPATNVRTVRLSEVPKYASIARGDTITTSGYSFYFPEGVHIGTIEKFVENEATVSWDIDVRLAVDMAALDVVLLVKNPEVYERIKLEEEVLGTTPE
jgi:rod shape-determining protein MreC